MDSPGQMAASADRTVLRDYFRIAMRWRFVLLGALLVCLVVGLIGTLLMTPMYTASSTIEISRESNQVTDFQGVEREVGVGDQEFYQTQYGLLKSRSLSERVATQLRLVDDPAFFARFGVSPNEPAFAVVNGRYPASGRATRLRVAGEVLRDKLDIVPGRLSRLVDIKFTSPDAAFSAQVTNAWAENFIRTNLERKVQATSYGRDLLQRQLGEAKERLDESQRQLVNYASEQQIINLPAQSGGPNTVERSIVADELSAFNTALAQATTDRIQAQARYEQRGSNGVSNEALRNTAVNGLREKRAELAAQYQQMLTQFEPAYPPARSLQSQIAQLDRSIQTEEGRISGAALAEYRQAASREEALKARVNTSKSSYLDTRRRSIQYNIFQQEVDTSRSLYDGLLQRFKEIGVAGNVGINNISIVDAAQPPERPSSPRLLVNLLASMLAGLAIGGVLVYALEQMDEAIDDPSEIERRLNLPLLGSVPMVEEGTPKEALQDRKSDLVDAYLAVQTNLAFTTEHGIPTSLAVTSTRPAEGKSTTALALATTISRTKRRVILIDGDMRSPSIHHLAGVNHDLGLSNFLSGQDDIQSLIFEMKDLGIFAMTAGPIPPNAAELLTGNRLALLIEQLLGQFDHVVIDSPPVMGLADAPLIASRVEGVIYTVEAQGVRSSMVRVALARLTNANVRILGAVLTKFIARKTHYGYGYEYGYGYGRGGGDDNSTRADGTR